MNMILKIIFLISVGVVVLLSYRYFKSSKPTGIVIILNGPSASGKSSIQKQFQNLMLPNLWIKQGIDSLFDGPMPDITLENMEFWQKENLLRWVTTTVDKDGNQIISLHVGAQGERVAYGMNSAIAAYAQNGCNVIVDYIAYKKEWIDDLRDKLKTIKTVWVKVEIPLDVLEDRESMRATSPKGHARSHYDFVHWDIAYDFIVNSHKHSALEIAEQIKGYLKL